MATTDAYGIMRECEDEMDRLAEVCKRDGETRERALSRLVAEGHALMMSMARNRDAAHGLTVARAAPADAAAIERRLDAMAKRRAAEDGCGYAQAYALELDTPEGARLYGELVEAKGAASPRG